MSDGDQTPPKAGGGGAFRHWRGLSWSARLISIPIYAYRLVLSPMLPRNCRFEPTCSTYALEALQAHGPIRGTLLTLRRLSRCHPFKWLGAGEGYDPVPPRRGRCGCGNGADSVATKGET